MVWDNFCRRSLQKTNRKKSLWGCKPSLCLVVVVGLLFASLFCLGAQNVQSDNNTGGGGVFLGVEPLLDKYGYVSMNEDGTFYPNDCFEITYSTDLISEVDFEKIEIHYDRSVFSVFSDNFGVEGVGGGCFEVLSSASAGVYFFVVEVWGNRSTANADGSGSESYVMAEASLSVVVVEYDPHFTVALTYTVPTGNGSSSYEKPFAIVVRYEGNGPDRNLRQRAVVDDYVWVGYAQKIPQIGQMQQSLTPNLTVASFLNQSSNTQFLVQGIDDEAKVSQIVLGVDGKGFTSKDFPVGFLWDTNTNHSYVWTQNLPVDGVGGGGVYGEWFEWQASIVFPPSIDPNQSNQTTSQEDLQNQLVEQFNTPNGTLITSPFGNTVTAMYAHNKHIDLFAKEVGVAKNQTLNCLTPLPLYFTSQERYAKLQYQLNSAVVAEIANQGFTHALYYNLTTGCSLFGAPRYFDANATCEYEFFDELFNVTAYKWDHSLQKWSIDPSVNINAVFESAFNFTETDLLRSSFEKQTSDPQALKLAMADLYDSGPQIFRSTGSIEAYLKRTSPLYYNLQITAGQKQTTTLQRTIELNFRDNNPYHLPLNFDPTSPLQIDIIADTTQNTLLSLNAPKELGGLTNITVYLVTNIPTGKTIQTLSSPDSLSLSLLKTMNLTLPQEQTQKPLGYEENYQQFYQDYQGYSTIAKEETWGFSGQTQIANSKDQKIVAL